MPSLPEAGVVVTDSPTYTVKQIPGYRGDSSFRGPVNSSAPVWDPHGAAYPEVSMAVKKDEEWLKHQDLGAQHVFDVNSMPMKKRFGRATLRRAVVLGLWLMVIPTLLYMSLRNNEERKKKGNTHTKGDGKNKDTKMNKEPTTEDNGQNETKASQTATLEPADNKSKEQSRTEESS